MVEFKFRRQLGYFMFHTYIPTCLIVMMSWISFWIKPEAVPARVTLGVTSLLTLSTQHANSQKSLPPVSYIKVRELLKKYNFLGSKAACISNVVHVLVLSGCISLCWVSDWWYRSTKQNEERIVQDLALPRNILNSCLMKLLINEKYFRENLHIIV